MHIFSLDLEDVGPIREFDSHGASARELGQGTGEAHAFVMQFERGGLIGPHWSEQGMSALMVQIREFTPNVPRPAV